MDSARCGGPDEKISPAPGTNQIAGFAEFRPLTSREKDKRYYFCFSTVQLQVIKEMSFSWGSFFIK